MADVIHSDGGEMMRVIGGWPIDGEAIEILDVQTPEAQYQSRTWYVDNKRSRRCAAARAFARQVASIDGVREVWLLDSDEDLEVAVVLADLNLDCEMRLRGSFIEIVCDRLSAREGELSVFAETEDVPARVREGKRLDP